MWCGKCHCDVATELAPDNRRVLCSTCGAALGETAASQPVIAPRPSRTAEARELLDRWANSQFLDPYGPLPVNTPSVAANPAAPPEVAVEVPFSVPSPAVSVPSFGIAKPAQPVVVAKEPAAALQAPTPAPTSPPKELPPTVGVELDRITNEILARVEKLTRATAQEATSPSPVSVPITTEVAPAASLNPPTQTSIAPEPVVEEPTQNAVSSETGSSDTPQLRIVPRELSMHTSMSPHTEVIRTEPEMGNSINVTPVASPRREIASPNLEPLRSDMDGVETEKDVRAAHTSKTGNLMGLVGNVSHVLALVGILGMTAGFALIIVGTFGSATHFAPTGWLVATISQMLLFLAVVTMVSAGMNQAGAELREMTAQLAVITARLDHSERARRSASKSETPQNEEAGKYRPQRESVAA